MKNRNQQPGKTWHLLRHDFFFEAEHSHCIYPLSPTALQLKRHFLGRGCHWLIALVPTVGLAGAGSLKKLHFK